MCTSESNDLKVREMEEYVPLFVTTELLQHSVTYKHCFRYISVNTLDKSDDDDDDSGL